MIVTSGKIVVTDLIFRGSGARDPLAAGSSQERLVDWVGGSATRRHPVLCRRRLGPSTRPCPLLWPQWEHHGAGVALLLATVYLPMRAGGLFFGWREYSAECLEACGPFDPEGAGGDHSEA